MEAHTLEQRIERLERRNRTQTRVLALGGFAAVFLLVASLRSPQAKTIETRGIRVVDSTGRPRIELKASDAGPSVQLLDEHGNSRLLLDVAEDGPRMKIEDETRLNSAELRFGLFSNGEGPGLRLTGENGGKHAEVMSSRLTFFGPSGQDHFTLGVKTRDAEKAGDARVDEFFLNAKDRRGSLSLDSGEAGPTLSFWGKEGLRTMVGTHGLGLWGPKMKPRVALSAVEKEAQVALYDDEGRIRMTLDDRAGVVVKDGDGKPRVTLGIFDGYPGLAMLDSEKNLRVALHIDGPEGPVLGLSGADGKLRTAVLSGTIVIQDENEKPLWSAP